MFARVVLRQFYKIVCVRQPTRPERIRDAQDAVFDKVLDEYVQILQHNPDVLNLMWKAVCAWYNAGKDAEEYEAAMDAFVRVNGKSFLYFFTKQLSLYDEQYNLIWDVMCELYTYELISFALEDVHVCLQDSKIQSLTKEVAGWERIVNTSEVQFECYPIILSIKRNLLRCAVERVVDAYTEYVGQSGRTKRVLAGTGSAKRARFV